MEFANRNAWSFVARTVVFDRFIEDSIASGANMVVNLDAGLDTRPYRMALPSNLPWIKVDLPDLLAYKIAVLANETPRCRLERVALDLANVAARRDLFNRLSQEASRVLVITEGLVVYLSDQEAVSLAEGLAGNADVPQHGEKKRTAEHFRPATASPSGPAPHGAVPRSWWSAISRCPASGPSPRSDRR